MKKNLFLAMIIVFCFSVIGCNNIFVEKNDDLSQNQDIDQDKVDKDNINEPQKFYPDNNQLQKQESDLNNEFVMTQELQAKFYLVDKYNPGICYGTKPSPVPQEAVSGMIARNLELAKFIKIKYNLTSDLDIYNKIKQLNAFLLTKLAGGKYKFNFTDGRCCTLTAYEGEISIIGKTISDKILRQETKQNPC